MNNRTTAIYDAFRYRFCIGPLVNGTITVGSALYYAHKYTDFSWRDLAEFVKLPKQSDVFKLAHLKNNKVDTSHINQFLVIDAAKDVAYLYHHEHKPSDVNVPDIKPVINNGDKQRKVTAFIPTLITPRVNIVYPYSRELELTITPKNGYILGLKDVHLADPDKGYTERGLVDRLNDLLRNITFVGTEAGNGKVTITVKVTGEPDVISSETAIIIEEGKTVSTPTLTLPTKPKAIIDKSSKFDPITVADADDKLLTVKLSPFGCTIYGFMNRAEPLHEGELLAIHARQKFINECLANLYIRPHDLNSQLGVELLTNGRLVKRSYLVFEVADKEKAPTVRITSPTVTGLTNEEKPLGMSLEGTYSEPFEVLLKPVNCSIKGLKSSAEQVYPTGSKCKFTGSVEEINAELKDAKIVVGHTAGSVSIEYLGKDPESVAVEVRTAGPTEPETGTTLELSKPAKVSGALNAMVPLTGLAFSGTRKAPVTVTITPDKCKVRGYTSTPDAEFTQAKTITGTIAKINDEIRELKAIVGEQNGTVAIKFLTTTETIVVEKTPDKQ